jgi:hypothetical protein
MEEGDMDASDRQQRGMPAARVNTADPFTVGGAATAPAAWTLPPVTDEQHQVLRRVSEAGGNVHRNAILPGMLTVLVSADLLVPYGPDRVELTALAVQLLAGADRPEHTT